MIKIWSSIQKLSYIWWKFAFPLLLKDQKIHKSNLYSLRATISSSWLLQMPLFTEAFSSTIHHVPSSPNISFLCYTKYPWLCLTNFTPTFDLCVCAQSCLTLCDPVDCDLPGFSVHGVFQAKILEWVAISYSRTFDLLDPYRHLNLQTLMEKWQTLAA